LSRGKQVIAGVDEAGRGPLAGPVVAAAVILDRKNIPLGLNDSKKLGHEQREGFFTEILKTSHVAWASVTALEIDRINIRQASLRAMQLSVLFLAIIPDQVLIDGKDVPDGLSVPGCAYVKGDARSLSIAAASIVAKVVRDRMMISAHITFSSYGFDRHKGYATQAHRDALKKFGPCALHRRSFAPVRQMVAKTD